MRYLYFGSVEGDLQEGHCYASRAQKPHFCVKTTKNLGKFAHSDTKMAILCSKCPKTGVPDPKSAQKPRFCARNARKRWFQTPKAHKNLDFVLGKPENLTSGLVLVLLLMLIIDKLDIAIFCIDWIYNNNYFILHCQR